MYFVCLFGERGYVNISERKVHTHTQDNNSLVSTENYLLWILSLISVQWTHIRVCRDKTNHCHYTRVKEP